MNKNIILLPTIGLLAFISGSIVTHSINKMKQKKPKYDKMYAGNILCAVNEYTQEIELYLQITAKLEDIAESDTVTFKVKTRQVEPKEHIGQA